jgi:hypothetical protein
MGTGLQGRGRGGRQCEAGVSTQAGQEGRQCHAPWLHADCTRQGATTHCTAPRRSSSAPGCLAGEGRGGVGCGWVGAEPAAAAGGCRLLAGDARLQRRAHQQQLLSQLDPPALCAAGRLGRAGVALPGGARRRVQKGSRRPEGSLRAEGRRGGGGSASIRGQQQVVQRELISEECALAGHGPER